MYFQVIDYTLLGSKCYPIYCTGNETIPFNYPTAVEVDCHGNILVVDSGNHRLVLLSLYGDIETVVDLDILSPVDVTIDSRDRYIVIGESAVRIYNKNVMVKQFLPYYLAGKMQLPSLMSIDFKQDNDELYILDKANLLIQVFTIDGEFKFTKNVFECLHIPYSLHVINHTDRTELPNETDVLISDGFNHMVHFIHFYSRNLYSCKSYGTYGIGILEFVNPEGLASDIEGNAIICDAGNHRIQVIDKQGRYVASTGRLGSCTNCFHNPTDVTVHPSGFVIVADTNNNRLVVYL